MKFSIITLSLFSILLFSCGTSNKYIADDIYVLKPSELPIGESSADETSYAAFKQRKDGPIKNDNQVYVDQYYASAYRNCLAQPFWFSGCGCSYATWTQRSPYSSQYGAMTQGYYQGYGYGYGYNPYYSPYYSPYGYYSSFGGMYGSAYYSSYYSPYGNGYGGYGYGGNNYGYGGNSSTNHGSNFHNGPRGSASGYSNPNGRASHAGPVKSSVNNNNTANSHNSTSMGIKSPPVRRAISTINTTPTTRNYNQSTVTRNPNATISRNPNTNSNTGRTYQKPNAPVRTAPNVIRTTTPNSGQRSTTGGTVQRSGNYNQGSGNSNSGATKSSGGNSTPRTNTNTNTNTGRRP